jgi:nucleoside-diphosphate-sugar epimerase
MKVLLTGANGFVGSHIFERLCARGLDTVILLRPESSRRFLEPNLARAEVRLGSLGDDASLRGALRDVTHVIHAAGCIKALRTREFYNVNQAGTRALVQAIATQGGRVRRLVHLSSQAAVGPAGTDRPAREEDEPRPVSEYGRSKLAGEAEVKESQTEWVILRPPAVYGPRDIDFLRLFKAVRAHLLPYFDRGLQALSFAYVKDLANVCVECLSHPTAASRLYHVAADEVVTARALTEMIAALTKTWTVPLRLPGAVLWPVCVAQDLLSRLHGKPNVLSRQKYSELRAPGWVCDSSRLHGETGICCPTRLQAGLAETLNWYRREGWL